MFTEDGVYTKHADGSFTLTRDGTNLTEQFITLCREFKMMAKEYAFKAQLESGCNNFFGKESKSAGNAFINQPWLKLKSFNIDEVTAWQKKVNNASKKTKNYSRKSSYKQAIRFQYKWDRKCY